MPISERRGKLAETEYGTFDDLMQMCPETQRGLLTLLRGIILEVHPEAFEVVRPGERSAVYGLGPKKMSEGYAYLMPQEKWINLGFFRGADLPDPAGMLEGTGAKMRHIKVRTVEQAKQPATKHLIEAALKERKMFLGL